MGESANYPLGLEDVGARPGAVVLVIPEHTARSLAEMRALLSEREPVAMTGTRRELAGLEGALRIAGARCRVGNS